MSATLCVLDIETLQRRGRAGDEAALMELGRRVLDFDLCLLNSGIRYCEHEHELQALQAKLNTEIPPQCPHCDGWLTED
jgi:hypothetical protein